MTKRESAALVIRRARLQLGDPSSARRWSTVAVEDVVKAAEMLLSAETEGVSPDATSDDAEDVRRLTAQVTALREALETARVIANDLNAGYQRLRSQMAALRAVLGPMQKLAAMATAAPWRDGGAISDFGNSMRFFIDSAEGRGLGHFWSGDDQRLVLALVRALPALMNALASEASDAEAPITQESVASSIRRELLAWVDERIAAEVANRPDENKYKRTLDETWTQVRNRIELLPDQSSANEEFRRRAALSTAGTTMASGAHDAPSDARATDRTETR